MTTRDDGRGAARKALPSADLTPGPRPAPLHSARDLTGGGEIARIALDSQVYTLRITRAGKLILTK